MSYYGSTTGALVVQNGTATTLQHLRFSHQKQALRFASGTDYTIRHLQVSRCQDGLALVNTANIHNALFTALDKVVAGTATTTVNGQHWTVNVANLLKGNPTATISLANSLMVQIATPPAGTFTDTTASVRIVASNPGVFQASGGGTHYLVAASPFRKSGTTAIDSTLAADLKKMTTEAPVVMNTSVTTDTVLWRRGQRDVTATDLGYHYPAVDYLFKGVSLSAKLTISEGTVVAAAGSYGVRLQGNSQMLGTGRADAMNTLTRYTAVQESAMAADTGGSFFNIEAANWPRPILKLAFNRILTAGGYFTLLETGNLQPFNTLVLEHCQLRNIRLNVWPVDTSTVTVSLSNNLFERCNLSINKSYYSAYTPFALTARNNLFWRGSLSFSYDYNVDGNITPWTFRDNLLDTVTNLLSGANGGPSYVYRSHNGFTAGTTSAFASGSTDKVNLTADYLPNGTRGNRYYPTTVSATSLSALIGAGSQTHAAAGLTYFTVKTAAFSHENQDNATVDIGYHYPAQDGNGKLLDSDQDGLADYREDVNNSGTQQAGETGHLLADSDGDGTDDGAELALGLNPLNPADGPKNQLALWRFNSQGTDRFYSEQGDVTVAGSAAVQEVNSWDGDAARVQLPGGYLGYAWRDASGRRLLNPTRGTVQFWFKPNWSSAPSGTPDGVATWRKLISVQAQGDEQEFWSLELNSQGNQLRFWNKTTSGTARPALTATVALNQHTWRLFTVTYDSTGVELWLDKTKVAFDNLTVGVWPSASAMPAAKVVWIGGWNSSVSPSPANGSFENVAFFNYRFNQARIEDAYQQVAVVDSDGDGLSDITELATHFLPLGSRFLPGNRDSDNDGLPDSWEYQHFPPPAGGGSWVNPGPNDNPDIDNLNNQPFTNFQEFLRGRNPKVSDADLVVSGEMPYWLVEDQSQLINLDFTLASRPQAVYGTPGSSGPTDDHAASVLISSAQTSVLPVAASADPNADHWNLIPPGVAHMSLATSVGTTSENQFKVGSWFGPITYVTTLVNGAEVICCDYYSASGPAQTPNPSYLPGGTVPSAPSDQTPPFGYVCPPSSYIIFVPVDRMIIAAHGEPKPVAAGETHSSAVFDPLLPWLERYSRVIAHYPYCRPRYQAAPNPSSAGFGYDILGNLGEFPPSQACPGIKPTDNTTFTTAFRYGSAFYTGSGLTDATRHPMFNDYQIGKESDERTALGAECKVAKEARSSVKLSAIPRGPWRVIVYSGAENHNRKATITIGQEKCYITGGDLHGNRFEKGRHYVQAVAEVDDSGIVDISFDDQSVINGVQLVKIVPPAEPQWDQGTGNPVTANAAGMIVRWLHTAGATAYELWRATGNAVGPTGTWTLVADNLRSRSFLDTGASAGVYNYYRLIAKNERFSSTGSTEPGVLMSVTLVGNRPPFLGSFKPVGPAWQGKRLVLSLPEVLAGAVVSDYEGSPVTFRIEGLLAGRLWVDGVEVTDSMLRQQANPPGTPATTHDPLKFSLAPGKLVEWEAPDGEADLVDALQLRAFDGALFSQTSVPLPVGIKPVLEVAWWGSRFQNTAGTGEWVDIQTATSRHLGLVYEWQNHAEWWSKFPAPIDGPDQNNTRLEDVVQLTSAMGVTLALKADGTVYSWGTASPLLGHNMVLPPNRPAWQLPWFESEPMLTPYQIWPLTGTARATQVAAGSAHAGLVTTDGKVYLWGEQTTYEAGKATLGTLSLAEDRLVEGITVGAGWPYDPNDGWESRWATDSENQVAALPKPTLVRGLEGAVSMACSDYATAVLTSSGTVYDWGSLLYFDGVTTYHQYGSPQTFGFRHIVQSGSPQLRAMPQNKKVIQLAGGSQAFLALTADGEVYAWGANDSGAFADPAWVFAPLTATAGTDVPRKVPNLPTSIVQLAASGSYFAALTKEGAVFEWGSIADQTIPKARPIRGLPRVSKLLLTWERAFAVDFDGKVWGWGRNRGGTSRWSEHAGLLLPDDHRLTLIDPVQLADLKNVQAISTATQYNLHASTERLPNAPQGLVAIGKESRIELAWQRFEGATEYRIYASPTATGAYVYKTSVRAGELTTQTWADTSIQNGQESFYKVSAVAKGTETPLSSFAWGRAVATPAFPGGSSLVITKLSRELQLRWCPASGALRYRIHRAGPFPSGQSTVTEADYRMLYLVDAGQLTPESSEHNGCNRLNFTDCALEVGKRYFYRIIPENTTGTGALQSANELVIEATAANRPTAPSASPPFTYPADGRVQANFALTDTVGTKPGWVLRLFEIPGMTRGTGICPGVETLAPAVSDPGWRLTRSLVVGDSTAGNGAQWFFSVEEGTARRFLWFGQLHNGTWYKLVVTSRDERGENAVAEDLTEVFKPTAPAAEAGAITDGFAQAGPGYIYLRYKSTADFSTTFIQQGGNCSYFMDYPWSDGSQITETWILNLGANSYTATVQPGGRTDINTDWDTGPLAVQTRSVTTPLNITNRVGDKMVRLSWKWDGYQDRIFYAERVSQPASAPDLLETDPSLNWQLIKEGRENVLRDTGLDNAYEYRYRLIALNPETGALDWEVTPWLQPKPSVLTPPTLTATAGNSAVKLVFTPGTAQTGLGMQWYSLFHQAGSSAPVELLSTFAPLPGGFSYVHEPLGNGSTHIYWAEVTYDSDEIYQTTPVPVTPAGDLPPFLPDGLRVRSFNLGNGNSRIILDWEEVPGARAYHVYSKLSGVCGPPFLTSKFSYEVTIPTANVAGTTFFVTAIGANGAESQVAGTPCTGGTFLVSVVGQSGEQLGATPGDSVSVQSVVLTVPGGTSVVGPTNVTLRASVAISPGASASPREVSRVEFYANQVLIGKSDQPPFVFDWHNPPATAAGSPHQLVAVAVTTAGGRQASLTQSLSVTLRPPLSEFNHSETDFELRGAGGSFPLTRVYRSGDTGFNLLGRGWRFNFEGAELTTGAAAWAELGKGWELKTAPGGLGSLFPVVQESAGSNHEIKVTLPDGQDLRFAAVVELPSQRGANMFQMQFLEHWELFADESEPATFATLRFVSVDGSDAALSIPGYPESIGVGGTRDQQANRLLLSVVGDFTPSVFVVTLADGSSYEFVPTVSANRMRLTRISDRSGNSFAFELYGSGSATPLTAGERWQTDVVKRIAIKAQKLNMDGSYATIRQCWIDDVSLTSNAEWMLYDPEVASGPASLTNPNWPFAAGTGTWPGVRYVTTAGLLSEVRKLNNRTSGAVDTHRYAYINFQSQDLLETIRSPEGVTLLKNTYALNSDGLIVLDYQEDAAGIKRDLQYATGAVTVPVMQGTTQLSTESLQYSADGQVTKTVSSGQTVENGYDDRGRLAYSAVRVDTTTVIPTTYDYDRQDRPVQVMNGNGQATRFEYTADSQPAKVTDARQNSTSYEYYSADWGQGYAGKLASM